MTVLIVEDDPMVSIINRKFASRLPFVTAVHTAAEPEEARRILREEIIHLVLLDVYFPVGKGPDLLQWIREEKIPVEVIFITADRSHSTVERALHLGALDYLVKPFTFERFAAALEEADRRIASFPEGGEVNQNTLDRVFRTAGPSRREVPLEKGLSPRTYETVLKRVRSEPAPFTAEKMGEELGMARVTIRRYLDFMVREEILDVELRYGKIGRPQHYYKRKEPV